MKVVSTSIEDFQIFQNVFNFKQIKLVFQGEDDHLLMEHICKYILGSLVIKTKGDDNRF